MSELLLGLAVILAVAAVAHRRWKQAREAARRPGSSMSRAIPVWRFDQIDRTVSRRRCQCGTLLRAAGEGSREVGHRRFRIAHLVCPECEREESVYFDVTRVFH
jgi:hypothetical protein